MCCPTFRNVVFLLPLLLTNTNLLQKSLYHIILRIYIFHVFSDNVMVNQSSPTLK